MRVYGELKSTGRDAQSTDQGNDQAMTGHDREREITLLENQIDDLRNQLARTETQLDTATERKLSRSHRQASETKTQLPPPPDGGNLQTGCSGSSVPDSFPSTKSDLPIFRLLIHSKNPVWVALLRDGNPISLPPSHCSKWRNWLVTGISTLLVK